MTTEEILQEIAGQHKTLEILELLMKQAIAENKQLKSDNMEYLARINAIRKINKGKNEGIENLCILEG